LAIKDVKLFIKAVEKSIKIIYRDALVGYVSDKEKIDNTLRDIANSNIFNKKFKIKSILEELIKLW
jgi:hypothetical protein